ncbi:hypothetical protein M885DRAFT_511642 [Pelagophyceae sp. CCMP2097]|nr:hypothetical protein M885DRAFT_511642 [Pelagophyceae sp. CCMP2097]
MAFAAVTLLLCLASSSVRAFSTAARVQRQHGGPDCARRRSSSLGAAAVGAAAVDAVADGAFDVSLTRPLGITVREAVDGAVFVTASRNGAKLAGIVVGDVVVGVSAVFGDDIWDVRGKGIDRVESLIRSRSGAVVSLRLERGSLYHVAARDNDDDETFDIDEYTIRGIFDDASRPQQQDDCDPDDDACRVDAFRDAMYSSEIGEFGGGDCELGSDDND